MAPVTFFVGHSIDASWAVAQTDLVYQGYRVYVKLRIGWHADCASLSRQGSAVTREGHRTVQNGFAYAGC
jgi:hypothetical protein